MTELYSNWSNISPLEVRPKNSQNFGGMLKIFRSAELNKFFCFARLVVKTLSKMFVGFRFGRTLPVRSNTLYLVTTKPLFFFKVSCFARLVVMLLTVTGQVANFRTSL